jgi:hypothetical protein
MTGERIFIKFDTAEFYYKICTQISMLVKLNKINGYLRKDLHALLRAKSLSGESQASRVGIPRDEVITQ